MYSQMTPQTRGRVQSRRARQLPPCSCLRVCERDLKDYPADLQSDSKCLLLEATTFWDYLLRRKELAVTDATSEAC